MRFIREQSDRDRLSDMVTAAMETGNPGKAREILAEHKETFSNEVASIRAEVLRDYGVKI